MKKIWLLLALLLTGCDNDQVTGDIIAPVQEVQEVAFPAPASNPTVWYIKVLGREGFQPAALAIEQGDTVVWVNEDPTQKALVLTLQKDKSRQFVASDIVEVGEAVQYTFDEAAHYDYWTVGYGVRGSLDVRGSS